MRHPVLMFDFGNVVGLFDYSLMFDRFGPRLGLTGAEFEALMRRRESRRWPWNSSAAGSTTRSSRGPSSAWPAWR